MKRKKTSEPCKPILLEIEKVRTLSEWANGPLNKKWEYKDWMEWMGDTPYTIMTTKAPAVLINMLS